MGFGITVVNDADIVQIDETYSQFQIIETGSIIGYPDLAGGALPTTWFADTIGIFIRPPNASVAFGFGVDFTSGTYVYKLYASTITTFQYVLVKKMNSVPVSYSGYGLEVFRSDGTVAFNSNYPILRIPVILHALNLPPGTSNFSLPAGIGSKYLDISQTLVTKVNNPIPPPAYLMFPAMTIQLASETSLNVINGSQSTWPQIDYIVGDF